MRLSRRLDRIQPSPTIALNQKAKALAAAGKSIVNFSVGEPDFPTPERIIDAASSAARRGETKYTACSGIPELKQAIASAFQRDYGKAYAPSEILVTAGAKQALFNLCLAVLEEGDEVILFSPCWVSYADIVRFCGGKAVILPTNEKDGFLPKGSQLQAALTSKTKMLILNSPCNPTGTVYAREVLLELAGVLQGRPEILVVTDDIYRKLIFGGTPYTSIGMLNEVSKDRLVIVDGVSKTYSMTGWRIGYAAGPKDLIAAMDTIQSQSTSNASSVSQWAALEALSGDQVEVQKMRKAFEERRDLVWNELQSIPNLSCAKPGGAFYLFPNVSHYLGKKTKGGAVLRTDVELSAYLLDQGGLAVVPGSAFEAPGYLRLTYSAGADVLKEGCSRFKKSLESLL